MTHRLRHREAAIEATQRLLHAAAAAVAAAAAAGLGGR